MAVTLLASVCPAVQTFGALIRKIDVYSGASSPPLSYKIPQAGNIITAPLNTNGFMSDMQGRYGGGLIGLCAGLVITAGAGLQVNVSAGHAMIDGLVENPASFSVTGIADSTARIWIWLKQNGVLVAVPTSTVPPAGLCCLVGSCTTAGGAVTAVDTSGVMYLYGGIGHRYTADPGIPTDTPPTNVAFYHTTAFGAFKWEGTTAYKQVFTPSVTVDPTSVAEGLAWLRSDTLKQSVYSGGVVQRAGIGTGIAPAAPSIPITVLPITSSGSPISWTVPSTLTEFNGTDANRAYPDLTNATQIRLVLMTQAATSVPFNAPTMAGQYSIDNGTTWNYLDGGTGPHLVFAAGKVDSGWVTLVGAAKASNVLLRIVGTASSGTAAVAFGSIYLQAK